jgi:hypothetical protein
MRQTPVVEEALQRRIPVVEEARQTRIPVVEEARQRRHETSGPEDVISCR